MAKADESRRLADVSESMILAIEILVTGGTQSDAGEAAEVTRQTVSKWQNHHPGFIAELNLRREQLREERTDRIRDLDAQALAVISDAVEQGDRSAAMDWLKLRRLNDVDVTLVGPTRPAEIIEAEASSIRRRPENAGPLADLDLLDITSLSRSESITMAKREMCDGLST